MKSIISWKDFLVEKQLDLFQGTSYERPELKYGSGSNGDREGVQKLNRKGDGFSK